MEEIAIHWTVFVFHGQYWIIIGENRSILSNDVKQVYTAGLDSLVDVMIRVIGRNWSENTLEPGIPGLEELCTKQETLGLDFFFSHRVAAPRK